MNRSSLCGRALIVAAQSGRGSRASARRLRARGETETEEEAEAAGEGETIPALVAAKTTPMTAGAAAARGTAAPRLSTAFRR